MNKSGTQTSEFWLTLGVLVGSCILLGMERISPEQWMVATGIVSAAYTGSRTMVKSKNSD